MNGGSVHYHASTILPNESLRSIRACAEAMLRSAGFEIVSHPEREVYVCRVAPLPAGEEGR